MSLSAWFRHDITLPKRPQSKKEQLAKLKDIVGLHAFASLRRGGVLRIWRRSTPHNWYINNKKDDMLWHSGDVDRRLPDLSMFLVRSHSGKKIEFHPIHNDGYKSESSEYVLKRKYRV